MGVTFGTTGVRVHKAAGGEVTVTDGPFAEAKEDEGHRIGRGTRGFACGPGGLARARGQAAAPAPDRVTFLGAMHRPNVARRSDDNEAI